MQDADHLRYLFIEAGRKENNQECDGTNDDNVYAQDSQPAGQAQPLNRIDQRIEDVGQNKTGNQMPKDTAVKIDTKADGCKKQQVKQCLGVVDFLQHGLS